ncbi:Solute carrier family 35 member G1 [Halotydeus destructor]|nr:Solute carrier family 35 member G1 [Halotydeus destructor]
MSAEVGSYKSVAVEKLRKIKLAGILLASFSGVITATESFCVNLIPEINAITLVITRSLIQLVILLPAAICWSSSLTGARGERWPLFFRGIAGATAALGTYSSFQFLSLGDASTIVFSSPVVVFVLACLLIGETCGVFHVCMVTMTLGGVILISKPTFAGGQDTSDKDKDMRLEGTLLAMTAALSLGFGFILLRKLQKTPTDVVVIWMSVVSIFGASVTYLILYPVPNQGVQMANSLSGYEILVILVNGACGLLSQLSLTVALKIEKAGVVALARCSNIVAAYILQVSFLSQPLEMNSVIGSAIIMSCVIASAIEKLRVTETQQVGHIREDTPRISNESQNITADNISCASHS